MQITNNAIKTVWRGALKWVVLDKTHRHMLIHVAQFRS